MLLSLVFPAHFCTFSRDENVTWGGGMLRIGRNAALAASLGLMAACDQAPPPAPQTANEVADADLNATANDSSAIPAQAPIDLSFSERFGSYYVTIRNTGSAPVTIQKLIVNGQENDSDCNIKVFRELAEGGSMEVPVPRCGAITQVRTITDKGERLSTWDNFSQNVRLSAYNVEGYRRLTITNIGSAAWTVNKIVINGQTSDADCNIKVFREVAANSSIDVSADRCGQINSVNLETSAGSYPFTFDNGPAQDTGNTTGM
jgi:hypothetical protein